MPWPVIAATAIGSFWHTVLDIDVEVADAAGNLTALDIPGVTCASEAPTVQIVSLQDNASEPEDMSRRLLAASNADATLVDEDPETGGAQHTVVACSNASVGGSAQLFAGLQGALAPVQVSGSPFTVALEAADERCPENLSSMAVFPEATLPASTTDASGELSTYSAVRVDVTDISTQVGQSPAITVWVDSTVPVVRVFSPSGLCGSIQGIAGTEEDFDISLLSGFFPVEAWVEQGGYRLEPTYTFDETSDLLAITFPAGDSTLRATATEPSGNVGALDTCTLTLGDVATITWVNPSATTLVLGGSEASEANVLPDGNAELAGWQGTLEVSIVPPPGPNDIDGETLQFQVDGVDLGDAIDVVQSGSDPIVITSPTVTIADGESVTLSAVLSESPSPVVASLELSVDTAGPAAPTDLAVTIEDRRHTTMRLQWTAPADARGVPGSAARTRS